ncbi:MAG: sensor histidine kinase [Lachnospiraceae bacterium]|nr:sensor histidine kinase [Lachnospiraceae bacterium]
MKLFLRYLKQRRHIFIVGLIFCAIFTVSFLLYRLPVEAVIYPTLLCAAVTVAIVIFDFLRVRQEHNTLQKICSITVAIGGAFPKTDGIKDEDYQKIIHLISEEHDIYRTETNRRYSDMIDYYTVWAHQIKTPIAAMRLHLQNEDSSLSRKLSTDLHRIEQYVEMVLTFLRLNSESTDYVIKEYDLDRIVKQAVKKFSTEFIGRKLILVYEPLNTTVITDEKWLSFVIEQVLSNALKYTPAGSITITLENEKTLRIRDTGIGIAPEDLPRIFENGYTGYNGRTDKKASGIGLYLCKRVCSNLGHTITARSIVGVGTTIDIDLTQTKLDVE